MDEGPADHLKKLGLKELVAIGIGGMIGGGIFSTLGLLLQYAGVAAPFAFSLGAIIALLSAYSYAKFSYYHPSIGGTIEYIAMVMENLFILDYINALLWIGYIVMVALYAYAFGSYSAALLGFREGTFWYLVVQHVMITLVLLAFTAINVMGSHIMSKVEDVLVYIKVGILLFFIAIGFMRANPSVIFSQPWPPINMVLLGGLIIFSAYEGFGIISNASLEAKKKEDVYRAFFISVMIVAFIYISIAYVAVATLNPEVVAKYKDYALGIIAEPLLGKAGFVIIAIAALLSTASAINATIFGAGRIAHFLPKVNKVVGENVKAIELLKYEILLSGLIALVLANLYDLSNIAVMGSLAFLLIYATVNYAATKMADVLWAKRPITFTAFVLNLIAASVLAWTSLSVNFWSQLMSLATLLIPPFIIAIIIRPIRKYLFYKHFVEYFGDFFRKPRELEKTCCA